MENSNDNDLAAPESAEYVGPDVDGLDDAGAAVLPTMDDLDRLAADLDRVDATLAALDRNGSSVADTGLAETSDSESLT